MPLVTKQFSDIITFIRASAATRINSLGFLETITTNNPRFDYDPVTLEPRGLLIEEQRTNLLLYSRDMTQTAWTKTDVTAARTQVGIDGAANSACLMTEGVAGTASTFQLGASVTAGATLSASVVVKRGNNDFFYMFAQETTGTDGASCTFNIAAETRGTPTAFGLSTSPTASITNLGGGWFRCVVSCVPNGSYTVPRITFRSCASLVNTTRVNNATYILDAAQLEVGAFATSVIPTTTATVTRSADLASMTGANFSSWFNAAAGSFVVEADLQQTPTAATRYFSVEGTGQLQQNIATNRAVQGKVGTDFPTTSTLVTLGSNFKAAVAYDGAGNSVVGNGGTVVGTSAIPSGNTSVFFGSVSGTSNFCNSHIRRITYYPRRLSNTDLQTLTA